MGCQKVCSETAGGAKTDRRELRLCIASLAAGDVLVVVRLDRLARSTRDLLNVLAEVTERHAAFRSLSDAWADTTTPHGRLMLTVLGGLAEFQRELIKTRTGEGRARTQARGVKFGRKSVLAVDQRAYVAKLRAEGESVRHIARIMGVSKATISRIAPVS
ncbi:Resolvase domain [Xanthobacter versatilis]|uniref:Resolvase domain n=1 Tax=Xanthobacter autotrophicus (strain ATCC BAA-1158 / Py2) TaxID=78245 RepID=A7IE97_XANP2|nr:Resolvase domain [Xanthobacter autotrophicus Py2]